MYLDTGLRVSVLKARLWKNKTKQVTYKDSKQDPFTLPISTGTACFQKKKKKERNELVFRSCTIQGRSSECKWETGVMSEGEVWIYPDL